MRNGPRGETLDRVSSLFHSGAVAGLTDGQLLERFATRRGASGELAFAALVERHGSIVLSVCQGVLRNRHDAEDAFQATFLVLARRADSIRKRESVASWLHGVALRVASEARSAAARRRWREKKAAGIAGEPTIGDDRIDLVPLLHEEVGRLPSRYREPVVLCFFEGLTHEEAADQLGWPVGTVKSRLARGKARLRARLTQRGFAPTAGLVGVLSAHAAASAAVPAALAEATVRIAPRFSAGEAFAVGRVSDSVELLAKGTLKAMLWTRWKIAATFVLSVGVLGAGVGVLVGGERDEKPGAAPTRGRADPKDGPARIADLERRLLRMERKLDAALGVRRDEARGDEKGAVPRAKVDPDTIRKVRARYECLVEKVRVKVGQSVKKGDPLAELFSSELAAAKIAFLTRSTVCQRDERLYDLHKKLVETGAISQRLWVETQNDKDKSRLEAGAARDRLFLYGLSQREIDAIKDEEGEDKARFTLRSPVDGTVIEIGVGPQDVTDPRSVLMLIETAKP